MVKLNEPALEKRGYCHFFKFSFSYFLIVLLFLNPAKQTESKNSISSQSNGCSKRPCFPVNMHRQTNWTFNHHHFVKFFSFRVSLSLYISFSLRFLFPSPPCLCLFLYLSLLSVTHSLIRYHLLCVSLSTHLIRSLSLFFCLSLPVSASLSVSLSLSLSHCLSLYQFLRKFIDYYYKFTYLITKKIYYNFVIKKKTFQWKLKFFLIFWYHYLITL